MRYRFKSRKLEQFYYEEHDDHHLPPEVVDAFFEVMAIIEAASGEHDLYAIKGLRFEKLKGKRKNEHSMRLNDQFRLIVTIERNIRGNTCISSI